MLDVRSEADYNLFHIQDAQQVNMDELLAMVPELHLQPANTLFVVMSNDETAATEAWKMLQAEAVPNAYILEGGINNWLATFGTESFLAEHPPRPAGDDQLKYTFDAALGSRYAVAEPDPHLYELEYEPKVQMELKRAPTSGGCG